MGKLTWDEVAEFLFKHGVPHNVIKTLPDMELSALFNRPVMDIYKFDEYVHSKYGNYEDENKSLENMFAVIFENDKETAEYIFAVNTL